MFPNNCIALLQVIIEKKIVSYATAFLIGPDLAITCAHNIPKEISKNQILDNGCLILFVGQSGTI
jgi:V8-like Glu-specific endopeptidase